MTAPPKDKQMLNMFLYLGSLGASIVVPLLTLPILSRFLAPKDFGLLALSDVYATFVMGIVWFGFNIAYERNYFQYTGATRAAQLLYTTLFFGLCTFGVAFLLTVGFRYQIAYLFYRQGTYVSLPVLALAGSFLGNCLSYFLVYYRNGEDARTYLRISVAQLVLGAFFSVGLVAGLGWGIHGIVYSRLFSSGILLIILLVKFLRRLKPAFSVTVLRDGFEIGLPLMPRLVFGVVGTKIDKYLLGFLHSIASVGIYSIAQKIAYMAFSFMTTLEHVFLPRTYRIMFEHQGSGPDRILSGYLLPFAYVSGALSLLLTFFCRETLLLLTPPAYHAAVIPTMILTVYYGILFPGKVAGAQLIFRKRTIISSMLVLVNYSATVCFSLLFIRRWDTQGAAWAIFASGAISTLVSSLIAHRYYPIAWDVRRYAGVLGTFLFLAIGVIMLEYGSVPYSFLLPVKCAGLLWYVLLGVHMKILTAERFRTVIPTARALMASLTRSSYAAVEEPQ